ncbi:outer membrane beta-barrel protein [Pinibacter soli]|uniref:Outer membrane beta-barrel protein n=1 Tax=Pinibacter soli TaxID=3044211 RepID=A0ABT6RIN4_9BACT|nr:outer membrane beta-barrel protein [Pinibacter soli]MDI3322436.1 outer membrane beta-barrel protein [Pinibacter soli]
MQYLDDNMDELFRKAAEEYPLKSPEPDWSRIESALQMGNNTPLPSGRDKRDNRRLLWFLLLLPLGFVFTHNIKSGRALNKANTIAAAKSGDEKTNAQADKQLITANSNIQYPEKTEASNQNPISLQGKTNDNPITLKNENQSGKLFNHPKTNVNDLTTNTSSSNLRNTQDITYDNQRSKSKSRKNQKSGNLISISDQDQKSISRNDRQSISNKSVSKKSISDNDQPSISNNDQPLTASTDQQNVSNIPLKNTNPQPDSLALKHKDSIAINNTVAASKNNVIKVDKGKQHGIYISLVGAADVSTIKMQTVEHMGFGAGVLVGYQFNKKWAVETGVLWDKKQYYSDGEYFDKSKTNIPAASQVLWIDGNCNMFEVPVNARYNFSFKKKGNFFATAGLTSYFMKKEDYYYWAKHGSNYYGAERTYNNSGNSLFSIMTLSAGYEHKLGKIGSLRTEPYLRLPLTGVGIGNLPISSIGLQVGITHHF